MITVLQCLCLMLLAWPLSEAQAEAAPQLTPAEVRHFSLVTNYECTERYYQKPALLNLAAGLLPEESMKPEDVLRAQERAYFSGAFDDWLKTWDKDSQRKWRDRLKAQGITVERWTADRKKQYPRFPKIVLLRWVMCRTYVFIEYEIEPEGRSSSLSKEIAVFGPDRGQWKGTLDLANDFLYRALMEGKSELTEYLPR